MHRIVSLIVGIIGIALAVSAGAANIYWSKVDQALGKPGTSQPGGVHKPSAETAQPAPKTGSKTGTIVFVCRYGSAKSVVAARFFNRIAAQEGLPFHAVARGIEPEPVIPPYVREPIRADRFEIGPEEKPVPLDAGETHDAVAVVCIMCKLPPGQLAVARQSIEWTDVPDVSDGYTAARDSILGHMKELMFRLVAK
jgi:protein-tyrosine-phosphatase